MITLFLIISFNLKDIEEDNAVTSMLEAIIGEEEEGAVDEKEAEENLEEKEEEREKIRCTSCEVYLYSQ